MVQDQTRMKKPIPVSGRPAKTGRDKYIDTGQSRNKLSRYLING
jgi:hypothetical protein